MDSMTLSSREQLINDYLVALTDFYGVFDYENFLRIFNQYNAQKLSKKELLKMAFMLNGLRNGYFLYDNIIVTSKIKNHELDRLIKLQEGKPYYFPTKEEIEMRFQSRCFEKNTIVLSLEKFLLEELEVSPLAIDHLLYEIVFSIKSQTDTANNRFKVLELNGVKFLSLQQADEYINKFNMLRNNTKTWINRGYSLLEISKYIEEVN